MPHPRKWSDRFHVQNWLFPWFPLLAAAALLWFFWDCRLEIFNRLNYPLTSEKNWLPLGWALGAVALLGFQSRRADRGRVVWTVRVLMLILVSLTLVMMAIGRTGWGRYHVHRIECCQQHFGVTARGSSGTESALVSLLTDQTAGQYLHRDRNVLEHLAFERTDLFARRPCEAALALGSLVNSGMSVRERLSNPKGVTFLLYALAGEVYGSPREKLNWLPPPTFPEMSDGEDGHAVFSEELVAKLLQGRIQGIASLTSVELEALVFCVANFPSAVDDKQRQLVQDVWLARVPQLSSLLAEGYSLGAALLEPMPDSSPVRIKLDTEAGYGIPYEVKQKNIQLSLARSLQSLLQLKSGKVIEWVDSSDADLNFKIKVDSSALYQYQREVYQWQEKYEPGGMGGLGRTRYYRSGRMVSEHVATGETTTETVLGATVKLDATLPEGPIEIDQTLAYWYDYLRRSKTDSPVGNVDSEELFGRLWPLGIHESYLRGADALEEKFYE